MLVSSEEIAATLYLSWFHVQIPAEGEFYHLLHPTRHVLFLYQHLIHPPYCRCHYGPVQFTLDLFSTVHFLHNPETTVKSFWNDLSRRHILKVLHCDKSSSRSVLCNMSLKSQSAMCQVSLGRGTHARHTQAQFSVMANISAHTASFSELKPRFKIAPAPSQVFTMIFVMVLYNRHLMIFSSSSS